MNRHNRAKYFCDILLVIAKADVVVERGNDVFCEELCYEDHFTFVETLPQPAQKRNPQVYNG